MSKIIAIFFYALILFSFAYCEENKDTAKAEYKDFEKSIDKEFIDLLKEDWKAYETHIEQSSFKEPKILPKITKPKNIPIHELTKSKFAQIKKETSKIEQNKLENKFLLKTRKYRNLYFNFYSINIKLSVDKKQNFILKSISKDTISKFWKNISKSDYKILLKQIDFYEKNFNLNNWALYQFIDLIGYKYYRDRNMAKLFTWFILNKKGYDAKIGYAKNKVYMLARVNHNLFRVNYLNIDNNKYYELNINSISLNKNKIYSYDIRYPKRNKALDFNIYKSIYLGERLESKTLVFNYRNEKYNIKTLYNKEMLKFYSTYPQSEYSIYFNKTTNSSTMSPLLNKLRSILKYKSELEAVEIILRFVQTSSKYKTDKEQFNHEKIMFPSESVFYSHSDSEDKSILFHFLMKNLLDLPMVALKYKDHLSMAVSFQTKVKGDSFNYKDKRYVITDPTYINANVGLSMPKYKNSSFDIIEF